jgi:hypothetical protein
MLLLGHAYFCVDVVVQLSQDKWNTRTMETSNGNTWFLSFSQVEAKHNICNVSLAKDMQILVYRGKTDKHSYQKFHISSTLGPSCKAIER